MRRGAAVIGITLGAAVGVAACGGGSNSASTVSPAQAPAFSDVGATECGTNSGRGCSPPSQRVDLQRPSFSNSTQITNPYFPISELHSAVLLGHSSGKPFRTETTLLPGTRTVSWGGQQVHVLISQYVAYLGGRLEEVALDRYAQADDGSVWYLGEDVFDYRRGGVAITEGTWLAGKEGPAAMIMPAHPAVGDVYRTENVPGIVFEEVKVKSVGQPVQGPEGPIQNAVVADELHGDGTYDHKIFAPGYGEFQTTGGGDLEALALAVPKDAVGSPPPTQLDLLSIAATAILESARVQDWEAVSATLRRMDADWSSLQGTNPPPLIAARMNDSLKRLASAVKAKKAGQIEQAAIDVDQSALDLELRYKQPAQVNADRFVLWTQQLRVDAAGNDLAALTGDVAVLEWIRDRFAASLDPATRAELDAGLKDLRLAANSKNLTASADIAARLAAAMREPGGPTAVR